jgi:hypothetical protein
VRDFAFKLRLGIWLLFGLEGEVLLGLPAHRTVLVILKAFYLLEFVFLALPWVLICHVSPQTLRLGKYLAAELTLNTGNWMISAHDWE